MFRIASLLVLLAAAPNVYGQAAAKKIAEKIGTFLDPTASLDTRGYANGPLARPLPEWLDRPQAAPGKPDPMPAAPPAPARKALDPRPVAEGPALLLNAGKSEPPRETVLPTIPLLRQYVRDVNKPLELPALATYAPDRISLADPSLEVSVQNALAPRTPERVNPAPFAPWNVPDPFENAETIRLRQRWAENPEPPLFLFPPTRR